MSMWMKMQTLAVLSLAGYACTTQLFAEDQGGHLSRTPADEIREPASGADRSDRPFGEHDQIRNSVGETTVGVPLVYRRDGRGEVKLIAGVPLDDWRVAPRVELLIQW